MRTTLRLLPGLLLCLLPAASHAINIPLTIPDTTLNLQLYVQPRFQMMESGSPDGQSLSYDVFVRRTRVQVNGNVGSNWLYLFQVDNANFGKFGNFSSRMIVQDAWASWGPWGIKGNNVLLIEGGLLFYPASRFVIMSSGNYPSVDGHPDLLRGVTATQYPANRTTGLQMRGWALDKKIGFRGGIYEGVQPNATAGAGLNAKRSPAFALFMNFDLIGSEEGTYLYQGMLFGKDPVLSVSVAGSYQSLALRTLKGAADQRSLTSTVFFDYPMPGDQELAITLGGYLYGNGTGSKDTGVGASVDVAYRYQFVKPFISWEYFNSDDCTATVGIVTDPQCAQAHTADSRNFRAGLVFYFNKSLHHLDLEFALNRGQSIVGPTSITAAAAGYTPLLAPGDQPFNSLARPASKTFLAQWTAIF
jgi:hypothetical protein